MNEETKAKLDHLAKLAAECNDHQDQYDYKIDDISAMLPASVRDDFREFVQSESRPDIASWIADYITDKELEERFAAEIQEIKDEAEWEAKVS